MKPVNLVSMVHLIVLGFWGGVVATEAVLELLPFRRSDLHEHSIRYHYWIDLLVELPLVVGVVASGSVLVALTWPLEFWAVVKIACAGVCVSGNVYCIVLVLRRHKDLKAGKDESVLRSRTRRILTTAAVCLPFAAAAAIIGFRLGYQRMADLIR